MEITFDKQNVAELDFQTLSETVDESNITGKPFNELMHFVFIERIMDIASKAGLKPEISRIEAVNNKNRTAPGVSKIPGLQEQYGTNDHRSYLMRRVFADINFKSMESEDYIFNAAFIYHQRGVQIGLGPKVKTCKNLCIMGAEHYTSSYGRNQTKNVDHMFELIERWLNDPKSHYENGVEFMNKLKSIEVDASKFKQLVGAIALKKSLFDISAKNGTQFLKESQIGKIIENYNKNCFDAETDTYNKTMNAYEIYNDGTEFHRPASTDMLNIIEGNVQYNKIFKTEFEDALID